ncbi:resolvase [Tissierella sp. P1]|uniref:recombinase family protein n=1 Tax=Tissierella sp. P1 TaxID=1280483 RepID=UPI000BA02386|nr:recombinase family protein [Tissierella sp. P1]OZV11237.1 resolvase [Tissierella sp. P1]
MEKIRVAIYARVSTAEQAEEGFSIDAQLETVRKICESQGKEVVKEYVDRGISGKSIKNRLALQEMLEDSSKGIFDEVAVWKTNRLARNHLDLLKMVERFEKNDVSFRSVTEPFETSTPAGKLLMNMLASIGEFERDTIVDNVKLGMKQRAKQGKWNGGKVLGYKSIKDSSNSETRLEVVQEEAIIIKEIFELYSQGKGLKAITNEINHKGYKTKRGNFFSVSGVKEILKNPLYIGRIRFNRYVDWGTKRREGKNEDYVLVDGGHEPIISKETWDKVQKLYEIKGKRSPKIFDGAYPLTGILKCPKCGASMVSSKSVNILKDGTKRIIRYYYCGNFTNKGSAVCKSNSIRADYAEEYVFSRINEILDNEKILKDIVENINRTRTDKVRPLKEQLSNFKINLKGLSDKRNKIFELYEDGIIDKKVLVERLETIDDDIQLSQNMINRISKELEYNDSEEIPYEYVRNVMMNFNNLLDQAQSEEKKLLLQLMINKITIKDRKHIDTIEILFDENVRKILDNNLKEEPLNDEGSSSFVFAIAI